METLKKLHEIHKINSRIQYFLFKLKGSNKKETCDSKQSMGVLGLDSSKSSSLSSSGGSANFGPIELSMYFFDWEIILQMESEYTEEPRNSAFQGTDWFHAL